MSKQEMNFWKNRIQDFPNEKLLLGMSHLVRSERRITKAILEGIHEVARRRLFADLGYPSLFEWLTRDLGYSNAAAYRRLQAAKLLGEFPDIGDKLQEGSLNLSTLSQVQSAIRAQEKKSGEKVSTEEKNQLLQELVHQSSSRIESTIAAHFPHFEKSRESLRAQSAEHHRLAVGLDETQREKLERVKEVCSHAKPGASWAELIEMMSDFFLDRKDPLRRPKKNCPQKAPRAAPVAKVIQTPQEPQPEAPMFLPSEVTQAASASEMRRGLNPSLRRMILRRDQGRCIYRHPQTGRVCGSRYQVEVDHLQPRALGGSDDPENLRCLCRTHNQRAAEVSLGKKFMEIRRAGPLQKRSIRRDEGENSLLESTTRES